MNLAHTLRRIAAAEPGRPALFEGDRLLHDYGDLARRAARLAAGLRARGWKPGDRIVLFMHNHPAYLELMYGAWWAGLAVVPVNAKLHLREAQWIVEHAGARAAFVTADVGAELRAPDACIDVDTPAYEALFGTEEAELAPRAPDDLAWLFYEHALYSEEGIKQDFGPNTVYPNGLNTALPSVKSALQGAPLFNKLPQLGNTSLWDVAAKASLAIPPGYHIPTWFDQAANYLGSNLQLLMDGKMSVDDVISKSVSGIKTNLVDRA